MLQTDPFSYVQRSFPPVVGCLTSSSVEQICQKNNLSFVEMVRPFCLSEVEHRLRDPSGNDHPLQKLLICIQDAKDRPPQSTLAKKILNESVNISCENIKKVTIGHLTLDVPAECPWFQSWTNTFLQVQFPSDHEFTKHLLGCLLVTSSVDPPETLQLLLQSLQQMQAIGPNRLSRWFMPNIFKFYVLVHDSKDGNKAKALNFFNSLKTAYGPENCYFLEINSQQNDAESTIPDYWSSYISKKSVELDGSDQGSSPRTPAELNSISGMPSSIATETELSSRGKDLSDVGQEVSEPSVAVVIHPLSPDVGSMSYNPLITDQSQSNELPKIVNVNVWNNYHNNLQFGACLSNSDIESIKSLVKHLALEVLIPHVEKQIFQLSDLVSNKKGMSRSLLSATKRLFGTTKPGSPSSAPLNSVIYAHDAPELYYRRLGDLYFMFTNYSLAFQAYHSAKRDFGADQAWIYYAGALEMAALSSFMQGEVTKKAIDYMEEAILIYLNSCKLPQFATRATLLSTPFLKERHMYGEAAKQLIRMASEDSDLRSALLLEQASYCFLYSTKPSMSRKYAFHMVLAGHRFSKGGQKKHALRCYKQAFQLYKDKGWSLAEDHIHFTVGKLAGHLKLLCEGSASLASLLSSGSKQTPPQQETYLREYLQMIQQLNADESSKGVAVLPLPIVEDNNILVLVSTSRSTLVRAFEPDSPADSVRWSRMEELAMTESQGPPMIFRPTIHLFSKKTINTNNPVVVVNESINVQVSLRNPLQIVLPLLRVQLLWNFTGEDGQTTSNEFPNETLNSLVKSDVIECIQLDPSTTRQVTLSLVPVRPGQIDILGMIFSLTNSSNPPTSDNNQQDSSIEVSGKQIFVVRGPKLKRKSSKNEASFEKDKRLEIKVVKSAPFLKLSMETNILPDMLCGEIQEATIKLVNEGNSHLKNLFVVTSSPQLVCFPKNFIEKEKTITEPVIDDVNGCEYTTSSDKNNTFSVTKICLENDTLLSGQEMFVSLWVRAPDRNGPNTIDLLFYYENAESDPGLGHRISRCSIKIYVHQSIQFSAAASRSTLCENKDTMNINVTVQNLNETSDPIATEISLAQISLASPKWTLHEKAIFSTEMKLKSQERYYLLIRAIRSSSEDKSVTNVCFDDKSLPSGSEQPFYDFYKWDALNEKEKENSMDLFNLPLYLRWVAKIICSNSKPRFVIGQSFVCLNQLGITKFWPLESRDDTLKTDSGETLKIFGPERPLKPNKKGLKSVQLENALSYSLLHERNVTHSFRQSRICCVSMKLMLRNCVDFPVRVVVNSPGSKFSRPVVSKTQLYTPHSSSIFSWTCRSNSHLRLEAHEQASVLLTAVFSAPGTYDLGSRLSVAAAPDGDEDYVNQVCRVQSAIVILGISPELS
ncbi:hypothetical protein RUM43_004115 [Polyplax serrata]|uniref:Trafficking protein particle complex subunit 8 n=1 Tax=Polyplax serrata TaxID=468196 RepID=A0AAN8SAK0_POLSC